MAAALEPKKKFVIPLPSPGGASRTGERVEDATDVDTDAQQGDTVLDDDARIDAAVANAATRAGHFTLFPDDVGGAAGLPATPAPTPLSPAAAAPGAPAVDAPSAGAAPVCCIVIGMAGSGKTTLMQRINAEAHMRSLPSYVVNLDPAVAHLPYGANIDIRDTVNYKEVMRSYGLGPNGAIVTSLNLFATRFEQVMGLLEKRAPSLKCARRAARVGERGGELPRAWG